MGASESLFNFGQCDPSRAPEDCVVMPEHNKTMASVHEIASILESFVYHQEHRRQNLLRRPEAGLEGEHPSRSSMYQVLGQFLKRTATQMDERDMMQQTLLMVGRTEKLMGQMENEMAAMLGRLLLTPLQQARVYSAQTLVPLARSLSGSERNNSATAAVISSRPGPPSESLLRDEIHQHEQLHRSLTALQRHLIDIRQRLGAVLELQKRYHEYGAAYAEHALNECRSGGRKGPARYYVPLKMYERSDAGGEAESDLRWLVHDWNDDIESEPQRRAQTVEAVRQVVERTQKNTAPTTVVKTGFCKRRGPKIHPVQTRPAKTHDDDPMPDNSMSRATTRPAYPSIAPVVSPKTTKTGYCKPRGPAQKRPLAHDSDKPKLRAYPPSQPVTISTPGQPDYAPRPETTMAPAQPFQHPTRSMQPAKSKTGCYQKRKSSRRVTHPLTSKQYYIVSAQQQHLEQQQQHHGALPSVQHSIVPPLLNEIRSRHSSATPFTPESALLGDRYVPVQDKREIGDDEVVYRFISSQELPSPQIPRQHSLQSHGKTYASTFPYESNSQMPTKKRTGLCSGTKTKERQDLQTTHRTYGNELQKTQTFSKQDKENKNFTDENEPKGKKRKPGLCSKTKAKEGEREDDYKTDAEEKKKKPGMCSKTKTKEGEDKDEYKTDAEEKKKKPGMCSKTKTKEDEDKDEYKTDAEEKKKKPMMCSKTKTKESEDENKTDAEEKKKKPGMCSKTKAKGGKREDDYKTDAEEKKKMPGMCSKTKAKEGEGEDEYKTDAEEKKKKPGMCSKTKTKESEDEYKTDAEEKKKKPGMCSKTKTKDSENEYKTDEEIKRNKHALFSETKINENENENDKKKQNIPQIQSEMTSNENEDGNQKNYDNKKKKSRTCSKTKTKKDDEDGDQTDDEKKTNKKKPGFCSKTKTKEVEDGDQTDEEKKAKKKNPGFCSKTKTKEVEDKDQTDDETKTKKKKPGFCSKTKTKEDDEDGDQTDDGKKKKKSQIGGTFKVKGGVNESEKAYDQNENNPINLSDKDDGGDMENVATVSHNRGRQQISPDLWSDLESKTELLSNTDA